MYINGGSLLFIWANPKIIEEKNNISNGDVLLNRFAKRLCINPRNNNSSGRPVNKNIPKSIMGNCHSGIHSVV